jgi:hypothetical protein
MLKNKKAFISCIVVLFFICMILAGCTSQPEETTGLTFIFTDLDGQKHNLTEYYGNVILLDFMAVNCYPCMNQMFELKKISENFSKDEVSIISIDVWIRQGENVNLLKQFIQAFQDQVDMNLNWTFGVDDQKGTLEGRYANKGVPTLYILDTKGNIYYSNVGYETYDVLASKINEILGK